jgi:indolepyruvate ferredoxin oxidoreductase
MDAFGPAMTLRSISLEDKYDLTKRHVLVTGYQAFIRACLMQKERDCRAGLNTAGFVTGYRGSPLGGLDQQFMRAAQRIAAADINFQPGLNEELAATALWGSQRAELYGEGKFDGVFGAWYGKGPGVDRSGDVFRHANLAGTSRNGGVIALIGDDHTAESSTTAHQSEFHFVDVMMPILNPAGVQEIIDYALYGWAMSRYSGTWTALKCMHETVESTGVVDGYVERLQIILPDDFRMPEGGLNIRFNDTVLGQEARLHDFKRDAMLAFVRANKLNKMIMSGGRNPKIGIITTGKAYLDVRQAFDELGIDEVKCNNLGLRLFKVGCSWPLSRQELVEFANGLDLIIVIEEKRSLIEMQVREELYGNAHQPVCIGKKDERGNCLFPVKGALNPNDIAICIGERLLRYGDNEELAKNIARLKNAQRTLADIPNLIERAPYFCSGCPHNTSTRVPEGSRAYAGIGCHYMAQWMDRNTLGFTQMGGEGANWIGEAPFSHRPHVFQNIGDGTYNHSGYLAIRAAIASNVNITYKILFNDAVAMTGGQPNDGGLTVPQIAAQVVAAGVKRVVVITDGPGKYTTNAEWPCDATVHHRDDLDAIQRELAIVPGVSVLIYDQTCATEKRRRRKRGTFPDPDKRVIINDLVCEGCGDCGVKSNCVSVQPLMTEWGRKRTIDQSSCNEDYSCIKGFCPSFVTVEGAKLKKRENVAAPDHWPALPTPQVPPLTRPYGIILAGIGGTGIVTTAAIISMAAHLEEKGVGTIDMAGLAQKGGAVCSHIRVASTPQDIHSIHIGAGGADLVLGSDIVVAGNKKVLSTIKTGKTRVIVNTAEFLPGDFTRHSDFSLPTEQLKRAINDISGVQFTHFIDASGLTTALLGDSIGTNMFMLGHAYQIGGLPLSSEAIERAIEMNGESVSMNIAAFRWGRRAAVDAAEIQSLVAIQSTQESDSLKLSQSFDEMVARREIYLSAYQNKSYARHYRALVNKICAVEAKKTPNKSGLAEAVARYLFKLMAYKDEYEVARLYTESSFLNRVKSTFDGDNLRLQFHLAPPFLARLDPFTGESKKISFGPWMLKAFAVLAKFKFLRGTAFDPFGYSEERRNERQLIKDYEVLLDTMTEFLSADNHATAVTLASIPEKIRGYGSVKQRHLMAAKAEETHLREQFYAGAERLLNAAE